MAKYTNDELLEAFGEMTLVELSEFVKAFEEKFDVEAAAPVAAVAAVAGAAAPSSRRWHPSSLKSAMPRSRAWTATMWTTPISLIPSDLS